MSAQRLLNKNRLKLPGIFLAGLWIFLTMPFGTPSMAAVGTNPASGNPLDYGGAGDWNGSGDPDRLTNESGATVDGSIYGNPNTVGTGFIGGGNQITNYGTVNSSIFGSYNLADNSSGGENTIISHAGAWAVAIYGSDNQGGGATGGENTIINHGDTDSFIIGSRNQGIASSGGGNNITNTGVAGSDIYGSLNQGDASSGGGNIITNYGQVATNIYGSNNSGDNSYGGGNRITNQTGGFVANISGSQNDGDNSYGGENIITNYGTVFSDVYGSYNQGAGATGGENTITNYGTITNDLHGSYNLGDNSSGGGNRITNYGTVNGDIVGGYNVGDNATSPGNIIANYGTVDGNIYGSLNSGIGCSGGDDVITNRGTVGGSILAGDGSDRVIMEAGPDSVGGLIDGGDDTDTIVYAGGTWTQNHAKVVNFEDYEISATRSLILEGAWDIGARTAQVNGGTLTVGETLNAGGLTITSGSAVITGRAVITGQVNNAGTLDMSGSLSAGSLTNSGNAIISGSATISGAVNNSNYLNVSGALNAGSLTNSGSAYIIGNATISGLAANSGTLDVSGSLNAGSLSNPGNAYFRGTATISGQAVSSGYLNVSGLLRAGSLTNTGTAYLAGRTIAGGLFANSGDLTLASGGRLNAGSFSNSGYAVIRGTADINGASDNSGRLTINGTLTTPNLTNSGVIGGTGTIHADIINTGTIAPGNSIGTLNVASSVVFEPGSTLVAELDCTCLCDLLNVSGGVTINGGSIYTTIPRSLYADGHAWNIISASQGVSGQFDAIDNQTKSEVLSLGQKTTGDSLSLVIVRKSYGAFASGGAADAGRGLDKLVPLASGDMESLLISMDFDMTADEISQVVGALNPEMYTAFSAASLKAGRLFDRAMGRRLTELGQRRAYSLAGGRDGNGLVQLAAAEAAPMAGVYQQAPRGWGMWGRAMGLWADQDRDGGYLGRGQTTGGAAIGADYMVSDKLVLGLSVGATRTDLSWSNGNYSGDIDAMHTGLYARAGFGGFFTRATASYARLANSATRPVNFEGFDSNAKADFDADLYAAGLALGYQAKFGDWLLEPLAGLDYQHLREDGFSENGAGFLGYDIAVRKTDSTLFNLGLSATRHIQADGWDLLPSLGISWQHRFGDDRPSLDASFTGYGSAPFTVSGAEFPSDLALIEAGLSLAMRPGLDFFADYSLAVADGYNAQTLTAGLKYSF